MKPEARKCERCGKTGACFPFTLMPPVGKPKRGYYHLPCFNQAKVEHRSAP